MDAQVASLTEQAATAFGHTFRYSESFSTSWVEAQLGITRGRRVAKTTANLYDAVWNALDQRYPERQVDWPCWCDPRPLCRSDAHFLDFARAKPLEKNIITAIYSAQAVQIAGNKDETALFDLAWRRPPLNFDLTWTRPLSKKRGLKSLEEEWLEAARHDAKAKMSLESIFVSEARPSSSSASATPEVFRFDYAEQAVKYQVEPRTLRSHLAGLTWNAGSTRQGLDIASFVAGTWSYICLQEADASTLARLKACDYEVVSQGDLAVAMPRDFLRSRGQMVQVVERDCESGQWALRAIFARFDLKAPADWPVQHLVLGSCHLNNVVAREKRGLTRELLQELFAAAARASGCDTLGVDFNQGIPPVVRAVASVGSGA